MSLAIFLCCCAPLAVAQSETAAPATLKRIETLCDQALAALRLGRDEEAAQSVEEAASLAEKEANHPLMVVDVLNTAVHQLCRTSGLRHAERLARLSLALAEQHAPGSPDLAGSLNALGNVAWGQGDLALARECFERALPIIAAHSPETLDHASLLDNLGNVLRGQGELVAAKEQHLLALAIVEKAAPDSLDVAGTLNNLGILAAIQGDFVAARDYWERALAIKEQHAPGSMELTTTLNNLGNVADILGDPHGARGYHERALEILERLAPGSMEVATSLYSLGMTSENQGDLTAAQGYYERALELRQELAPGSMEVAASLFGLGNLAASRGDLLAAKDLYEKALAIEEHHAPGSVEVASSLDNLGSLAAHQGDLAAGRDYHQRALAIKLLHAPGSLEVATSLNNLGTIASVQGDLAAAQDYHERALAILEPQASGALSTAAVRNNLGNIAAQRHDFAAARAHFARALAIQEEQAPDSLDVANTESLLGNVAALEGGLAEARAHHERALALREEHAPGSLDVATSLHHLGSLDVRQGDPAAAQERFTRALAIQERHAPRSLDVADTLHDLGALVRDAGDPRGALGHFARAWEIAREQRRVVVGDEAARAFTARYAHHAAHLVQARLELGEPIAAFQTLEEGRAHALLQLLSERGLARAGVETELVRRYEAAEQTLQQAGQALAQATGDEAMHAEALASYTRARLEHAQLLAEVRRGIPGLEPRRPTFEEARGALPRGAVLAAFSIADEESALFVIPADPERAVAAIELPFGEDELAQRVSELRERIGAAPEGRGPRDIGRTAPESSSASDAALVAASRSLFQALFPPEARAALAAGERLVVSPDGPLWELPFAALVTNADGPPLWLGLSKPLSYTPSLTVLALERERERAVAPAGLELVVGDPAFVVEGGAGPEEALSGPTVALLRGEPAQLVNGGRAPERLPASADEARRIGALYGVEPLLGAAASEAAVRERLPRAAIVHLATHGYFHPTLALSSGVLLAAPAEPHEDEERRTVNDGTLQAWELGGPLTLAAELVVLSACETGRGERVRGEGCLGLTRAFQAAGAKSVVATHWKVADASTAEVMVAFHTEELLAGIAKDEALRRALAAAAARPATSAPRFWAPYFLTGDADGRLAPRR